MRRTRMRFGPGHGLVFVALLVALLASAPALADDPTADAAAHAARVDKLNEEGTAAYRARDYRRANEKFQQAYALDPDPNILYNIAKTYELLGDDRAALEKFEQFVAQPGADPQGRTKANAKIVEIRARLAESKRPPPPPPPPAPDVAAPARPPPPREQRLVLPTIAAAGVGLAGVAVGGIFGVTALAKQSSLNKICKAKLCPETASSDISTLRTSSTLSTVGFVVGGVGIAAAVVLYLVGRPASRDSSSIGTISF